MNIHEGNYLIEDFLNRVKSELPRWVKNERSVINEVMEQLEDHIWEKAIELSDLDQPTDDSIRLAIAYMGDPKKIAEEYKQGSTPKVFISNSLWPTYKIIIIILFINLVIFNSLLILQLIISYYKNPPPSLIVDNPFEFLNEERYMLLLGSIYLNGGLFGAIGIITIIFFWLSKRGYYPENYIKHKKKLKNKRKREELIKKHEELIEKGLPISPETGEPLKPFVNRTLNILFAINSFIFAFFQLFKFEENTNISFLAFSIFIIIGIGWIIGALLGNKHILVHQIVIGIVDFTICIISTFLSIIIWTTPDLLMIRGFKLLAFICSPILPLLIVIIFLYRIKKLDKYKIPK